MITKSSDDIVSTALRLLRVYGADESPTAQELTHGYDALVSMLGAWSGSALMSSTDNPLPTFPDGATGVSMNDMLPELLTTHLSNRIAPEYGVETPVLVVRRMRGVMHSWKRLHHNEEKAATVSDAAMLGQNRSAFFSNS
ncbi:MAG: hypothetical protein ACRBC3_19680 [Burkholderiaceae bacterium]